MIIYGIITVKRVKLPMMLAMYCKEGSTTQKGGKIFLIPSSMKSEDIATILSEGYDVELLQRGFYEVSEEFQLDYLFVDTHPELNEETLLSIGLSNSLVVILRPDQQDYLGKAVIVEVARELEVPNLYSCR